MQEYLQLGHMRKVSGRDKTKLRLFLPHQAVIKESSATTKTRVVFDASSQYLKSLNDALCKGPVIQSDLFILIMRSDVINMFYAQTYKKCTDKY